MEAQSMSFVNSSSTELNYNFVYISHPRAVTQLSWRKTSKYMPKWVLDCEGGGVCVANLLY